MPKPPLSRRNLIVSKVIEWCDEWSTAEVVFCSELYGAIPMMFADDFGSTGEYCFDEPKRLDKWRQIAEQEQLFPEFRKTLAN